MNEIERAISNINYGLRYEDCGKMVVITKFSARQALSALEKQIPKRPMLMQLAEPEYMCECGMKYWRKGGVKYCIECGQKLDWGVEE